MSVILTLATASEESPVCKMMDELRDVLMKPCYNHVTISALIGVLEMLKYEQLARNME